MNAREMFEKLGYKQDVSRSRIKYSNACGKEIYFWLIKEYLSVFNSYIYDYEKKHLTKDELKATIAQARELGWLDDEC